MLRRVFPPVRVLLRRLLLLAIALALLLLVGVLVLVFGAMGRWLARVGLVYTENRIEVTRLDLRR